MKTLKPLFLLAALFVLASTGCKKNDSKPSTATVSMAFKFNGTSIKYSAINATYYKTSTPTVIQIMGSDGTQVISLMINDPKTGTYDLATSNSVIASYSTVSDFNHTYLGTSGKLVITTLTADAITGTFEFSGMNGLSQSGAITEGTFSAKIITQ